MNYRVPLLTLALSWSALLIAPFAVEAGAEAERGARHVVAVENVCAWPNLTLMRDGTIVAVIHNQPFHGQAEGDVECWASRDGLRWEKRGVITRHEPNTIRMNHAAGLAGNGDLIVLCSGWTDDADARPAEAAEIPRCRAPDLGAPIGGRWPHLGEARRLSRGRTRLDRIHPVRRHLGGRRRALHTSCYQGEYSDPAKSSKTKGWRSWHFRSDDDGRTWRPVSLIGPRHNETDIFPLGGKSWLAAARIDAMELFRSDDDGATWQGPGA